MAFPESWMNELMNKNEIVSVISDYTRLDPKGGRLWGHCPFHPERNPSFSVSPDKQLFHCFSCKAGGSVIQFIMQAESLSYPEAVRFLAQRVGMNMPDEIDDEKLVAEKKLRDRLYSANRDAARFYYEKLRAPEGAAARRYLIRRGIDGSTAARFGLGYSPNDWDALFVHLSKLGYTREELIEAGLCIKGRKDPERTYDFFRGRLMFPVITASGSVVAFGGRIIEGDESERKYMNTGDTLIYNKKHNVYAINMMKGKKLDELIMCEGYMDVISLHQHGVENAVASLGTALTSQQVRLMSRFAKRAVYAYDGDAAGQNAMLRGVDILSQGGVEPRVMVLPGGKDPDEYIRAYGREAFFSLKDSALTAVQFKINHLASAVNMDTPDGRQSFAERACKLLASLGPVERARYVKSVAEKSGIDASVIEQQCGLVKPAAADQNESIPGAYKRPMGFDKNLRTEIMLLACMLTGRNNAAEIEQMPGFKYELFTEPAVRKLADAMKKAYVNGPNADVRSLIAGFEDEAADAAAEAAAQSDDILNPIDTARDCISALEREKLEAQIRAITVLIASETDSKKRSELLKKQMELIVKTRS